MGRLPDGVPEVDLVGLQRPYVVLDQLAGAVLLEVVRSYRKRHLLEVWEGLREERQERQALLVLREASLFQLRRHLIVLPQAHASPQAGKFMPRPRPSNLPRPRIRPQQVWVGLMYIFMFLYLFLERAGNPLDFAMMGRGFQGSRA